MRPFSRVHMRATGGAAGLLVGLSLAAFGVVQVLMSPVLAPATRMAAAAAESAPASSVMQANQARQLRFERNQGQAPQEVRYLSRGSRHQLSVFDDGLALSAAAADGTLSSARLRFVDAQHGGSFEEREPVDARTHYLHGADPARWVRGVHQVRQLRYAEIYRGIDLVYYSRDGELEFDLVVKPGADPGLIRLQASGAKRPFIDADGHLLLDGEGGVLRVHRPVLQQNIEGQRITLDARWVLGAGGVLRFDLPAYDKRYPLVIDPVFKLLYSTYLGGVHDDVVGGMVLDANGNAYVIGHSGSEDWPVSGNAVQTKRKNLGVYVRNVVVTKFDAAGTLIWSTFLGGSVNDFGRGIGLDGQGRVVITGQTLSSDFPTTANALQRQLQGSANAFVAVLSPDGSALEYASLYGGAGGSDAIGLKIDPAGRAVIVGSAGPGLPTTAGAYQSTLSDGKAAFVAKFDLPLAGAAQLVAASYYGAAPRPAGQNNDNFSHAFALDATGAPWLTGQAFTRSLPVTADAVIAAPPSLTANCQPGSVPLNSAAYVAKLSADLKTLQYASYLTGRTGGQATCAEFGRGIALDGAGNVYVAGSTSSLTFPTTPGALQAVSPANAGLTGYAGFVLKLTPDGRTLAWSTYLGGNGGNTFFGGVSADSSSNAVWVHGTTGGGANFPLSADGLQRQFGGGTSDASTHQLDATTGALKYGSFLGGAGNDDALALAVDSAGNAFIAGNTDSRNLAVTPTAFQSAYTAGAFDGNDWFFRIMGSGAISTVRPVAGGSAGDVTLTVTGAGILPGAIADLVGTAKTITALATSVDAGGVGMRASFNLDGAREGSYDFVIRNADGTSLRKKGAFAVQAGGRPEVWAAMIGRPKIRTGKAAEFQLTYGNSGTVDAYFTAVWVHVPAGFATPEVVRTITDPYNPSATFGNDVVWDTDVDGGRKMVVVVPLMRAGGTGSIALRLTDPRPESEWVISAYVEPPWFDSFEDARLALSAVAGGASPGAACIPNATKPYLSNCLGVWSDRHVKQVNPALQQFAKQEGLQIDPVAMAAALHRGHAATLERALLEAGAQQAVQRMSLRNERARPLEGGTGGGLLGPNGQPLTPTSPGTVAILGPNGKPVNAPPPQSAPGLGSSPIFKGLTDGVGAIMNATQIVGQLAQLGNFLRYNDLCYLWGLGGSVPPGIKADLGQCQGGVQTVYVTFYCTHGKYTYQEDAQCQPPDPCKGGGAKPAGSNCSQGGSGGSLDPNDKYGLPGDRSASHYIGSARTLPYQIAFENQVSASLPAAEVVVIDQLDAAKLDLSTLSLGNVSWGSQRIDVPPGLTSYATVHNIDSTMSVRVAGSLNPTTGVLKWTFTSIDPVTKLPPSDPTLGFLPPNKNGTEGQGYVNFTISPKAGLPDGTRWQNSASIVFDANAAILTPTWVNTLDTTKPVGRVASATQRSGGTDVDVAWSATDAGSGVRGYTVHVSDNGGAYTTWQTGVSSTSAVWAGTAGHTYGFHVIATDAAGNTEAAKSVAEASVTVLDPAAGAGGGGGGGGGCTIGGPGQRDATLVLLGLAALVLLRLRRLLRRLSAPPATRSRRRAPG